MFEGIKDKWSQLRRGRPGSRFEEQFDRNRKEASSNVGRAARMFGGLILLPIGLFLLAVPGPGLVVIAIGAVMIARESRWAARALDWFEVHARNLARRVKRAWRRMRSPDAAHR